MLNRLQTTISDFGKDRQGAVALIGGLLAGVLATAVIASVEISDATVTKLKIQNQVDAAVLLAATRADFKDPNAQQSLNDTATAFLRSAMKESGIRAKDLEAHFYYNSDTGRIVGEASFEPDTSFANGIMSGNRFEVGAQAKVQQSLSLEVALVLDVSGSMAWSLTSNTAALVGSRRIDALRDGVDALVETLKENPGIHASISIIPYATSVDISQLLDGAGANQNMMFEGADGQTLPNVCKKVPGAALGHYKNDKNCVIDNPNLSLIANPSPVGAWSAERFVAKNGGAFTLSLDKPAGTKKMPVITQGPRSTLCYWNGFCGETVNVNGSVYWESDYFAPRSGILPLTDNSDDVKTFMNGLQAQGATAGHIGAAWGLYSLTDTWNSVFNHSVGAPAEFNSDVKKIMVVMTDGDFTAAHRTGIAISETYDYFQSVCQMARSKNVDIYTVGLRASSLTDTELTKCSGNADNYFPASNRSQLVGAFDKIAKNATRILLSH